MNNTDKIAFIDETGDEQLNLEYESVSDYYILSAVVVDSIACEDISRQFESLRRKYFKSDEIKSSLRSLKNNPGKRKEVLSDLAEIDFSLYLYVVNKKAIDENSGLQYPKNFIKYFHDQFYNRIVSDHDCVDIVVDEIKGANFHKEFLKYIKMKFDLDGPRLFYPITFKLVNSKSNICMQIADFIAGTVALSFEGKTTAEWHKDYKQILGKHVVDFYVFPEILTSYVVSDPHDQNSEFDEQIENRSLYISSEFINEHRDSQNEKRQIEMYCLQKLRENYFENGKYHWLQTDTLLEHFNGEWGVNTPQVLRGVIGRLRDAGNLL